VNVTMHDGSQLRLRKLGEDYDPTDRIAAIQTLLEAHDKGEIITGIFYVDTKKPNFFDLLHMTEKPLATLPQEVTRPPKQALDEVMESLR
jgi:2-oxoglutarate ferredoxin oxidoreductase subunit beta